MLVTNQHLPSCTGSLNTITSITWHFHSQFSPYIDMHSFMLHILPS